MAVSDKASLSLSNQQRIHQKSHQQTCQTKQQRKIDMPLTVCTRKRMREQEKLISPNNMYITPDPRNSQALEIEKNRKKLEIGKNNKGK